MLEDLSGTLLDLAAEMYFFVQIHQSMAVNTCTNG